MKERGAESDHATVHRWGIKYTPVLEIEFRKRKRAVDKEGKTIDFLLTKNKVKLAVKRFLSKATGNKRVPEKITMDGSAADKSAFEGSNNENGTTIEVC